MTISLWINRDCDTAENADDTSGTGGGIEGLVVNAACDADPTVDLRLVNHTGRGGIRNNDNEGSDAFSYDHLVGSSDAVDLVIL